MANNIKGLTVEINGDVSKLTDALKSTDTKIKSSSSELRELDKLLKLDPTNTELLSQKQQILAESISATKSRLESLRTAQEQAEPRLQRYDEWKQKNDVLSGSIEQMEKALQQLREQQKDVEETDGTDGAQYKTLAAQITETETKLKSLRKEQKSWFEECGRPVSPESYRALQREIASTEQKLRGLTQESDDTAKAAKALEKTSDDAADSVEDMGKSADKAGEQLGDGTKQVEEIGKESEKSGGKVQTFGDILKGSLAANVISDGLRAVKDGIRDIASDTIDAGSSAETAMAKLATIADTEKLPLKDLQAQVMELSTKTGQSVAEIAESVYSAISGGVDTADAVAVVEKATQLASGGFTDTATAIDVLTTAINAYGLSTEDAAKLSDYLLTTQNLGKTTVDELAGSMGKVIPLASAYGVQMDNLSSAYAIMTANGIATTESTTYIKSMLKELGDSGSKVSEVLKDKTGNTFAELNAEGMSLGDILAILGDAVEGDTGKFNELWSSSEAGIGALSILGSGSERYNAVLADMRGSAGATEAAYATMTDTFEHKSDALKNTLQNLEIEGFDGFKQSFKGAMDAINQELQSEKTKTAVKNLGKSIGSLTADLSSAAVKVLPKLADALSFVVKNIGKLTISAGAAYTAINGFKIVSRLKKVGSAFSGLWATISANPFGAILTAISALISVFSFLDAAIDTDAEKMERLSEAYRDSAEAALDAQRTRANAAREIENEFDGYRDLIKELDGIVDANGKIKTGYEERAAYITGRLSEVTGVEIEITDGVIQKYGELSDMLDEVLLKKQADALLSSQQGDYQLAKDTINSTETDEDGNYVAGSFRAYEAANASYAEAIRLRDEYVQDLISNSPFLSELKAEYEAGKISYESFSAYLNKTLENDPTYKDLDEIITQKKQIAEDARLAYDANLAVVNNYEGLQNAVWAEEPDAIRNAIVVSTNAQMQAGTASYASLYNQLTSQVAAYSELLGYSKTEGSSITSDQLAVSEDLLYRAFYEAYTAAVADGAAPDTLQGLIDVLTSSGSVYSQFAKSYGDMISSGTFVSAEDFVDYVFNDSGAFNSAKGPMIRTLYAPNNGTRFQQDAAGFMPEENTAATQAAGAFERVLSMIQDGAGTESTGDLFSAAYDRFREMVADAPILSSEVPLSVESEEAGKTNELINDLLGVVSRMDLTLVLDDGTLIARTIGKTNNALGVEVAREKRGALG